MATILPISKVKRTAKLHAECGKVGRDAAYILTLATEMFVELLAEEAALVAMVRRAVRQGGGVGSWSVCARSNSSLVCKSERAVLVWVCWWRKELVGGVRAC